MATCANCGSDNPDGSKFCGNCGNALQAAEPETTPPVDEPSAAPTTEQPGGYTPEHAAFNEALAAINSPGGADAPTTEQPPAGNVPPATENLPPVTQPPVESTTPQPPVTSVAPPPLTPTAPVTPTTETMPPAISSTGTGGPNKKVLAIVGGVVGLLLILGAAWFFFIRDDSEPTLAEGGLEVDEGTTEEEPTEEEVTDDTSDAPVEGEDPAGTAAFDSFEAFIIPSVGPYSITQESAEPCEPPCIFPESAHAESLETYQVTWDAGGPESEIYGEFLRYPTDVEAGGGVAETIGFLESSGYAEVDSFEINGVPGTVYQSPDSEVLLYQESNVMMGLFGNKGYPIEFVGYLNQ